MSRSQKIWLLVAGIFLLMGTGSYLVYTSIIVPGAVAIRNQLPSGTIINKGSAMMPTIHDGQKLTLRRFVPGSTKLHRGEIILFSDPKKPERVWIGRVIALGGDTISVVDGLTYLNGQPLQEKYTLRNVTSSRPDVRARKISADAVWVMGDNRNISYDSRDFGVVPLQRIRGIAMNMPASGLPQN